MYVYTTSGMKIEHLTTRLPGYVNKDTEAVIIHLGTNDIGGQANNHVNSHIRYICSKLKNVDYMPIPVTQQHLSRGGIHLNDKGQQKLTAAAMAEVINNHTVTGQSFHIPTIITRT